MPQANNGWIDRGDKLPDPKVTPVVMGWRREINDHCVGASAGPVLMSAEKFRLEAGYYTHWHMPHDYGSPFEAEPKPVVRIQPALRTYYSTDICGHFVTGCVIAKASSMEEARKLMWKALDEEGLGERNRQWIANQGKGEPFTIIELPADAPSSLVLVNGDF